MARTERTATAPARVRVGLPIVPDGSARHPLLVAFEGDARCNNGCDPCVTRGARGEREVRGRHVVVRDREPTLRPDLVAHVARLRAEGAAAISVLTNGRMLVYPRVARSLVKAGASRMIVKLFGETAGEHDQHTRVPGSFAQACAGIETARAAGAEVLVTFPRAKGDGAAERALAHALTGREPTVLPEPEVESHGGEYRYDVVLVRQGVTDPRWIEGMLPMVHVNTGPACNIRCVYCNVHGGEDQRLFDRAYVDRMLVAALEWTRRELPGQRATIDFIGGEPTLHPELPSFIARARELGFASVLICTNGALLLREGYLDALAAAGLTGVRFSFHDHRAGVAARLADVSGVGDKYVEVAKTLLARTDVRPHFFRILLDENLDALEDYLRLIAHHNRTGRALEVMLGMPSQRGRMRDARDVFPPLATLRAHVARAVELGAELGLDILLHHAPACLYPADPSRAMCLHVEALQVEALANERRAFNTEGDASYGAACEACPARTRGCHGLPAAYFEMDRDAAEAWLTPLALRSAPAEHEG
jgi:MoaA/NifB/PqqE/SkfB family radical SAM enzyme